MAPRSVPSFVRDLLQGDNLDEAVAAVMQVVGIRPMNMVPDETCEQALRALVRRDPSLQTTHLCVDDLKAETVLGGRNDPVMPGADAPWRALIFRLIALRQHVNAERAARAWYRALSDAALEADPPYEHRAFALDVAGILEALLGNDHWSEHWLVTGQEEALNYYDVASTFLGACSFVRMALRAGA